MIKPLLISIYLLLSFDVLAQKERAFVEKFCPNNQAHTVDVLVDCLTDEYAMKTEKKPAVFIICQDRSCDKHLYKLRQTIKNYNLKIRVFTARIANML